jgi:(p)ppGpp synthase/HD superfamily hydrolase
MADDQSTTAWCAAIAKRAHAHQLDKAGRPYTEHLARVAAIVATMPGAGSVEVQAAWLHDIIKDQGATPAGLIVQGVPEEVVEVVMLLTKPEGSDYLFWIEDLARSGNTAALRVKLADNLDNQSPDRPSPPGHQKRLEKKYRPAEAILRKALEANDA